MAEAVGANVITRKSIPGPLGTVANGIWRRLTPKKDYFTDYQFADWLTEVQALAVGYLTPPDVMHVLYGSQINLLVKRHDLLRCPLVVTFHAAKTIERPAHLLDSLCDFMCDCALALRSSAH